jgi:iron complex transport system substrate-binding protein
MLNLVGRPVSALPAATRPVTDQAGRVVRVPANPRRVVALAPSITEMVFELGQGRRLKGATRFSNFPAAAQALPRVGSYVAPDLERIVDLRPDLCLATKDGNPEAVVTRLRALHIPVYVVNPKTIEGVMRTFLEIGALLDAEPRAAQLVKQMRTRIRQVERRVARARTRPRVFFQIGIDPIVSVGSDTFAGQLIRIAGGVNVARGPVAYPRLTMEQVLALQPDVIVITSMARGVAFTRVKKRWQQWPGLPAVHNGRIFIVNANLFNRPSFRLVKGLELLAHRIHPELY